MSRRGTSRSRSRSRGRRHSSHHDSSSRHRESASQRERRAEEPTRFKLNRIRAQQSERERVAPTSEKRVSIERMRETMREEKDAPLSFELPDYETEYDAARRALGKCKEYKVQGMHGVDWVKCVCMCCLCLFPTRDLF